MSIPLTNLSVQIQVVKTVTFEGKIYPPGTSLMAQSSGPLYLSCEIWLVGPETGNAECTVNRTELRRYQADGSIKAARPSPVGDIGFDF